MGWVSHFRVVATLSEGTHSHKGLSGSVCGELVSPGDGRTKADGRDVGGFVGALFAFCLRRINTPKVQTSIEAAVDH